jgi:arylsulfatase B
VGCFVCFEFSNYEGGIWVNAFVSGGALPIARRGQTEMGLVAGWDWLATYVHGVAGLDPSDHRGAAAGLPPIDSLDMMALIDGTLVLGLHPCIRASVHPCIVGRRPSLFDGTPSLSTYRVRSYEVRNVLI